MRGKEARKKCPELQLVQVPLTHGKAELGPYRAAGKQVRCPTLLRLACLQPPGQLRQLMRRCTLAFCKLALPSVLVSLAIMFRLDQSSREVLLRWLRATACRCWTS